MRVATRPEWQGFDAERREPPLDADAAEVPDAVLFVRARAGERAALETLVRRHQKRVYNLCFKVVHEHAAAADITQRAFLKVLENMEALREPERFGSWLFSIAFNLARNHLRFTAKFVDDSSFEVACDPDAATKVEEAERWALVTDALATLTPRQRRCFELRVVESLPFREVARRLASTENAAKVNFHIVVKRLKSAIQGGASLAG